jgi:hypothetical protein
MTGTVERTPAGRWARHWPWLVLALLAAVAAWHDLDFDEDVDPEFPKVERPVFSRRPPAAYRLAEPGDTIDRIGLYFAAGAIVVATLGGARSLVRDRGRDLWPAAWALAVVAFWHAATPGPAFDDWPGWGWPAIADGRAPVGTRLALEAAAILLGELTLGSVLLAAFRWGELWRAGRAAGCLGLLAIALLGALLRQVEIPGVEPVGYWPRWAWVLGLAAFDAALIRALPPSPLPRIRWAVILAGAIAWLTLVVGGIWVVWYHRPLPRLLAVVPGKIYISAMPTRRGLEIAHERLKLRTIINLFPEDTAFRHPGLDDELKVAHEHHIRYLGSPSEASKADAFLDETLRLAQDPEAWPILIHCHGCMDRSPAWMGIYRFLVQGRPLDEVMREIERHRGYRPKGSVTLLFNRVLPPRAPRRYADDPTARKLRQYAATTHDPFYDQLAIEAKGANRGRPPRVPR